MTGTLKIYDGSEWKIIGGAGFPGTDGADGLSIQTVTHTDQLDTGLGYQALLIAEDGDSLQLKYNPVDDKWYTESFNFKEYTGKLDGGYYTTTYQGNDASMTQYLYPPNATLYLGGSTAFKKLGDYYANGYQLENRWITNSLDFDTSPMFEVKKWIKAGLKLYGRLTCHIINTDSTAGTASFGPGIRSFDIVDSTSAIGYNSTISPWTNRVQDD